jgi:putative ABC transport system permease protein
VGSLRHVGLDAGARDEVFVPLAQAPFGSMNIVARSAGDPATTLPAILAAVQASSSAVSPSGVTVLQDLVGRTVAPRRFYFTLAGWLAGLALALAAVGLYGLVSVQMAQRTREIGLRVALGGQRRHVLALVVATAFWPPVVGVAIGAMAAWSLSGWLRSSLFGIEPTDPLTYAMVAAVLLTAAAVAALVPARRALGVDPVVALRD